VGSGNGGCGPGIIRQISTTSDIGKALGGVSGALGAVGGLFAAVVALNENLRQGWEVLNALPAWGWAALAAVLLLLGIWQLVVWRQKRSELVRPETLRLERDNPEHLVGREDDVAALEQKCRGHGLGFLEGDSGSGKSALVRAGLLPRLGGSGQLLPLVVSICQAGPLGERLCPVTDATASPSRARSFRLTWTESACMGSRSGMTCAATSSDSGSRSTRPGSSTPRSRPPTPCLSTSASRAAPRGLSAARTWASAAAG
jgi:hypothetical protein